MGEMNWSIIKLFYKYMYTLIKVHMSVQATW